MTRFARRFARAFAALAREAAHAAPRLESSLRSGR